MKTLIFDIETSPLEVMTWGVYEENAIKVVRDWRILAFSYKWLDEKKIHVKTLPDYKTYKKDKHDDKELVQDLWNLLDTADVVVAHNGDKFDIRKTNARFIKHGLPVPSPYKSVDTLKIARKYFKFDSNKLDSLGQYLDLGRKERTGGIDLWLDCINGDAKAWAQMKKYNKQDVVLLEDVYMRLRPWHTSHPHMNIVKDQEDGCPLCGGKIQRRGTELTNSGLSEYQRYKCVAAGCGKWSRGRTRGTNIQIRP